MKHLKTVKNIAGLLIWTAAILHTVAQARKDITTHAKHGEHSPCACDKQCLGCLFEG